MKRTFFVCAALVAAPAMFSQEVLEELQPGDGDVTLIEDTGEDPNLDALLGDPNSGLFDNFIGGVWRDPFATPTTPASSTPPNSGLGYLPTGGSPGGLANMFAPGASPALNAFRGSMPASWFNIVAVDPVPEPGTWTALVAVSVIGIGTWIRRQRRA